MITYIYKIQNKINSKCYIGRAVNFNNRMRRHKSSKDNDYLHNAIRKYGWDNFTKQIIHECDSDVVDIFELMYQELWESHYTQNGYNIVIGGQKFRIIDEETRHKMSEATKGQVPWNKGLTKETDERVRQNGISLKGRKCSEEARRKMSKSSKGQISPRKGKKLSKETKLKISESLKGNVPWNKGIPSSEESNQKNREAHLGKKHSEETKQICREKMW